MLEIISILWQLIPLVINQSYLEAVKMILSQKKPKVRQRLPL